MLVNRGSKLGYFKLKLDSNLALPNLLFLPGQHKWIKNPESGGNVLAIQGPMGNGKTTLVKEGISKVLNRPFAFIALHFGFGFGLITSWVQRLISKTNIHARS